MRQLFCNGHGSLEESRAYSKCFIPKGKFLVLYTPPGAALADNAATFIMDNFIKNSHGCDLETILSMIQRDLLVKGRESKGFDGQVPPQGADSYPMVITGDGSRCVPDMTLEGDRTLSSSGCFDDHGHNQWPLANRQRITLSRIFREMPVADIVHWLACASDHTDEQAHSAFFGFKIGMNN